MIVDKTFAKLREESRDVKTGMETACNVFNELITFFLLMVVAYLCYFTMFFIFILANYLLCFIGSKWCNTLNHLILDITYKGYSLVNFIAAKLVSC